MTARGAFGRLKDSLLAKLRPDALGAIPQLVLLVAVGTWVSILAPGGIGQLSAIGGAALAAFVAAWAILGETDDKSIRKALGTFLRSSGARWSALILLPVFAYVSLNVTTVTLTVADPTAPAEIQWLEDVESPDSLTPFVRRVALGRGQPQVTVLSRTRPSGQVSTFRARDIVWVQQRRVRPWRVTRVFYPTDFAAPRVAVALLPPLLWPRGEGPHRIVAYQSGRSTAPIGEAMVQRLPASLQVSPLRPAPLRSESDSAIVAAATSTGLGPAEELPFLASSWRETWTWMRSRRELRTGDRLRFAVVSPSGDTIATAGLTLGKGTSDYVVITRD